LNWTQLYRRLHKKGTLEEIHRKRARKIIKVERPVVGAYLALIRAKRNQKPEVRQAARDAALKELKDQKLKKFEEKKQAAAKAAKAAAAAKAPKVGKGAGSNKPAKMGKAGRR